jgi:hypothetical protein
MIGMIKTYQIFDPVTGNISKKRFKTKDSAESRIDTMIMKGDTKAVRYKVI